MIAPREPHETSPKPLDNERLANRLEEVADLLEAHDENPFRVRAYRNAARTLRELDRPAHAILEAEGTEGLVRLPAIGRTLARAIEQLAYTGRLELLDELRGESTPLTLLASVAGVGPELARRIHTQLGINTLQELEAAAHDGRLETVPGMGPRRIRAVRETLAGRFRRRPHRAEAAPAADPTPVEDLLEVDREYREKAAAGKLRRIAPRRFNPEGEAWLPVLRARHGSRRYTALYSNTALAHESGATRDWVVIYREDPGGSGRWTVVTAGAGPLKGRRVVRGREAECADYYRRSEEPAVGG
jgi:hypothetical protein